MKFIILLGEELTLGKASEELYFCCCYVKFKHFLVNFSYTESSRDLHIRVLEVTDVGGVVMMMMMMMMMMMEKR